MAEKDERRGRVEKENTDPEGELSLPAMPDMASLAMLTSFFHETGSDVEVPKPFAREIFLFSTYIAGVMYVDNFYEAIADVEIGDKLTLVREPDNPNDGLAIRVQSERGDKLGYVPQRHNAVFSRLMDAGKRIFAKVSEYGEQNGWVRVGIDLYLMD